MSAPHAAGMRAGLRTGAVNARLGARALRALAGAGVIAPVRPDRLAQILAAPLRLGTSLATLVAVGAARHPDRPAVLDDRGMLTYEALDREVASIAGGLREDHGIVPGRGLAFMCRNHRGFLHALAAGSRCGADLLSLNTELQGSQLAQVLAREQPGAVIHDEEFAPALEDAGFGGTRLLAWDEGRSDGPSLAALAARPASRAPASRRQGKLVILTSGTTGAPKGIPREPSGGGLIGPMTTLISGAKLREGEPFLVAPPLFHGLGLAFLGLGLLLGAPIVLRRKFDPEATMAAIEEHRVATLIVVPVMLQRILEQPEEVRARYDTRSLQAVISAAAPLSPAVAEPFMDEFGDILYNAYGTSEVGVGAIAAPGDLRAAPGTIGPPPYGTTVKILNEHGSELPQGGTGHIFIGSGIGFEGYSGGGGKQTVAGLINSGDLGHFDAEGRLFIDGREDDMIVSGGENVFPGEVEDVLRSHHAISDVAVVGVDDPEFGQRLRAFVVAAGREQPAEEELKALVRAKLERYKVPRDFVFVSELPRNPTGKLLRSRLDRPAD